MKLNRGLLTPIFCVPALIVISASMSDICGRKPVTMVLILLFTVFSGGCAAAQNMTQLYVILQCSPSLVTMLTFEPS